MSQAITQVEFIIDTLYKLGYKQYKVELNSSGDIVMQVFTCGFLPEQEIKLPEEIATFDALELLREYEWLPDWYPFDNVCDFEAVHKPTHLAVENYNADRKYIVTLNGLVKANYGDYIITGVNGEKYPCDPEIFDKLYDRA